MTIATPTESYASVNEADIFLALKSDWIALDSDVKLDALLWGRYFIDSNFDCIIDMDLIDEEVKFANSLLAYDYFNQGDLFFVNQKKIRSKASGAGKAYTKKEYFGHNKDLPNSYTKVVVILKAICNNTSGKLVRV